MDELQRAIYLVLMRHMSQASEELRFSDLFEEQAYLEFALKQIYIILEQSAVGPARKLKQIRGVMEGLCPGIIEAFAEQELPENIDMELADMQPPAEGS